METDGEVRRSARRALLVATVALVALRIHCGVAAALQPAIVRSYLDRPWALPVPALRTGGLIAMVYNRPGDRDATAYLLYF